MEMRVEQLSVRSGLAVDTIRYYQSKGLVEPPRRQGRVAWYDASHLERLARIRALQERGYTLATIARVVSGELDAADEALIGELSGLHGGGAAVDPTPRGTGTEAGTRAESDPRPAGDVDGGPVFTLAELAAETGVPLALLKAVEAEGLLVPRRVGGRERYTAEDVAASKAGAPCDVLPGRRRATPPRRTTRSAGSCRPTRSSSPPSTPWSVTTSPGPSSKRRSTTWSRSGPSRSVGRSGTSSV